MKMENYLASIDELRGKVLPEEITEALNELKELEKIKPIRLQLMIAQAEAMFNIGKKPFEIYRLLRGKWRNLFANQSVQDIACLYSKISETQGDLVDARRNKVFPWICIETLGDEHKEEIDELLTDLQNRQKDFLEDLASNEKLLKLQEIYYIAADYVSYAVVSCLLQKRNISYRVHEFIDCMSNFSYIKECLFSEERTTFIIVASKKNDIECQVVARIISMLGKKVYFLTYPLECSLDNTIDMRTTIAVSIENMQECDGIYFITPLEVVVNGNYIGDNRAELIDYLVKKCTEKKLATIFANGVQVDDLSIRPLLKNQIGRLNNFIADGLEKKLSFGWVGDYQTYISNIYAYEVHNSINSCTEYDFSIVIPARNSAETLRYTLQTCLEQTYTGSYEIIISDNSTGNNASVYNLCKELNDPRIVYMKTPRDLHLPKSFEYAYLHSKGEYVLSIGSDDGILPWALEALDEVVKQYPDEEVIQWQRGFYAWPGFNGGQQHQFIIPGDYKKGEYNLYYIERTEYISAVLRNPKIMYKLPMLYINSCFKRSYLKTLLQKTGRLWDGNCQDIYMGVVTAYINPRILNMNYPLTIAGMSTGSVGARANMGQKTNEEFDKMMKENKRDGNVGGFCATYWERLLPNTGTDTSSLYGSFLRAISFGIIPEAYLDQVFNWKDMFMDLAQEFNVRDVALDRKIHEMQYAAMKHGDEFLQWFNETIYEAVLEPRIIDEEASKAQAQRKTYQCGRTPQGGMILDASEYGVENIHDAVKLFAELSGLSG